MTAARQSDDLADTVDYGALAAGRRRRGRRPLLPPARGPRGPHRQRAALVDPRLDRRGHRAQAAAAPRRSTSARPASGSVAAVEPTARGRTDLARRAFIGLGSNLGDRRAHLRGSRRSLRAPATSSPSRPVYETEPVGGPAGQEPYLNVVVELCDRRLAPPSCSSAARPLEAPAGRVRAERWGPRTLDVDVLLVEGRGRRRARSRRAPSPHVGAAVRPRSRWPTWPPSWSDRPSWRPLVGDVSVWVGCSRRFRIV